MMKHGFHLVDGKVNLHNLLRKQFGNVTCIKSFKYLRVLTQRFHFWNAFLKKQQEMKEGKNKMLTTILFIIEKFKNNLNVELRENDKINQSMSA